MQQLYIVRHADALFDAIDQQRPLSPTGLQQAVKSARWLASRCHQAAPLSVLTSCYTRAQQTAVIIAQALNATLEIQNWLSPATPRSAVMANWDPLWMAAPDDQQWIWVSHMPLVGELSHYLQEGRVGQGSGFLPAEVVHLEAEVWAAGCAYQREFYAGGAA